MNDEFVILTAGILKEILSDVPDDYKVRFEDEGMSYPVMDYDVQHNLKKFTLKPGDFNTECCETCKHYQCPRYCVLMDDIVEPCDNCGMHDRRIQ